MREMYPEIEPYRTHRLAVDAIHTLYVEECGNPAGLPVVFLHGGPGAGLSAYHRRFFDPTRYRIVLFDQRGAGQSTPFAELTDNTTWHLVADIEAIREQLEIERWVVFGGSWGSTLALAYAQTHAERVLGLVLRGIFLGRPQELRWFNEVDGGAAQIFPERWARFLAFIPEAERGSMLDAYWSRLTSDDEATRLAAARAWSAWEGGSTTLLHDPDAGGEFEDPHKAVSLAVMEAHYFRHAIFLEPDQLLRDVGRLRHIPATIVHGRYDIICPMASAYDLSQAWPEARLQVVLAGHSAADPAIVDKLVAATDLMADRYC
ncbi:MULTISPECIES: prolyl aminopeptidase [Rhodanobacter]|uniref:prolyl aminopeptidase n=1 Tax=Rhodanobacter TaxID=75309 RepID=UPI000260DDC6|nr:MULTISPECIES: prolyl aminopeptidase [Rhodanobacter]EIL99787.1 proline iminopeptidase [Rhodanobacter denitrificans]KZC20499.1 prolyl aminopeptidase [Rhodanobacter denitrificans]UJJ50722.1 prolyl aminopeptidase [Rhodanobacter denitrificans]UJJ57078.1 prolyl aminopeptidase [Rhodanobacter denitrificans]UJM90950.1 prolyl aminopeptidase [Rhodanobacter denitrificans]